MVSRTIASVVAPTRTNRLNARLGEKLGRQDPWRTREREADEMSGHTFV